MNPLPKTLLVIILVHNWLAVCNGSVTVRLELKRFNNHGGNIYSSGRCYYVVGTCNTFIEFCIKPSADLPSSLSNCWYHKITISRNLHEIDFQSVNVGIPKIIEIKKASWPGNIGFYAKVIDADILKEGDLMDIHKYRKELTAEANGGRLIYYDEISTGQRPNLPASTLTFRLQVSCDPNYYGPRCEKYCERHDDAVYGHYDCDWKGDRVCLKGWHNPPSCNQHCLPQNDYQKGQYSCSKKGTRLCYGNWAGQYCNITKNKSERTVALSHSQGLNETSVSLFTPREKVSRPTLVTTNLHPSSSWNYLYASSTVAYLPNSFGSSLPATAQSFFPSTSPLSTASLTTTSDLFLTTTSGLSLTTTSGLSLTTTSGLSLTTTSGLSLTTTSGLSLTTTSGLSLTTTSGLSLTTTSGLSLTTTSGLSLTTTSGLSLTTTSVSPTIWSNRSKQPSLSSLAMATTSLDSLWTSVQSQHIKLMPTSTSNAATAGIDSSHSITLPSVPLVKASDSLHYATILASRLPSLAKQQTSTIPGKNGARSIRNDRSIYLGENRTASKSSTWTMVVGNSMQQTLLQNVTPTIRPSTAMTEGLFLTSAMLELPEVTSNGNEGASDDFQWMVSTRRGTLALVGFALALVFLACLLCALVKICRMRKSSLKPRKFVNEAGAEDEIHVHRACNRQIETLQMCSGCFGGVPGQFGKQTHYPYEKQESGM